MKNCLFFTLIVSLVLFSEVHAQENPRIQTARIAFLTERISISPEQAQQFWPVYNEYTNKRQSYRKDLRNLQQSYSAEMSEEKTRQMVQEFAKLRAEQGALDKEYFNKFLTILKPSQVAELIKAEHAFTKAMLRRFGDSMDD